MFSLSDHHNKWFQNALFAQLFVYTILPLVLKWLQTNCGASTYFHGALMLTAYLV